MPACAGMTEWTALRFIPSIPMTQPVEEKPRPRLSWLMDNRLWFGGLLFVMAMGIVMTVHHRQREARATAARVMMLQGQWGDSWEQAAQASRKTHRPILIDFTADWCQPCQIMITQVFPDPAVAELLKSRYVLLRADVTHNDSPGVPLAMQYQLQGLPTLLIVDDQGKVLASLVGLPQVSQLVSWLEAHAALTPGGTDARASLAGVPPLLRRE